MDDSPVVVSSCVVGVVFMATIIILMAWFYIFAHLLEFSFAAVQVDVVPHSTTDITLLTYSFFNVLRYAPPPGKKQNKTINTQKKPETK